jgi:phenylpropionate dioxygenase-like ring-hydroxylating dioxygenase large terminal subunit
VFCISSILSLLQAAITLIRIYEARKRLRKWRPGDPAIGGAAETTAPPVALPPRPAAGDRRASGNGEGVSVSRFARNHWYVAAWSDELADKPLGRRLLGEPVVLFRQPGAGVAALVDRCPHRLVPLSMGTCAGGRIKCAYHGMEFDGTGRCVHIPAQDVIPPTARTRSFLAVERYGLIWIWMGDQARADPARIPKIERFAEPGWEVISGGYQHHPSNYINIVENLMDPAHTTFLHPNTIGNPLASEEPVTTERHDDCIVAYRWLENTEPSPHDRKRLNVADIRVDRGQFFYFCLPSTSRVETIVVPTGTERTEQSMYAKGLRTYSYKFLTPETESATHFFWLHVRNYLLGDRDATQMLRSALEKTFNEDLEIEVAMQRAQDELGIRQVIALGIDRAPMMATRLLRQMIEAESAVEPSSPATRTDDPAGRIN